jgi:AraC family transcriptional regulator
MRLYDDISLGTRLGRLELPGLWLTEVTYAPGTALPAHAHRNPNITLVLEGGFEESVEGDVYDTSAGSVVFKPAGTVHANRFGDGVSRSLLIEFRDDFEALHGRRLAPFDRCRWLEHGRGSVAALELLRHVRLDTPPSGRVLRRLVGELFATLPSATNKASRSAGRGWVREARQLLEQPEDVLSVREVAGLLGLHPVSLARTFRNRLACTPREYRQRWRVGRALALLGGSDDSLGAIAQAAGFCDQSHLCRSFHRQLGVTPGAYRGLVRLAVA